MKIFLLKFSIGVAAEVYYGVQAELKKIELQKQQRTKLGQELYEYIMWSTIVDNYEKEAPHDSSKPSEGC